MNPAENEVGICRMQSVPETSGVVICAIVFVLK